MTSPMYSKLNSSGCKSVLARSPYPYFSVLITETSANCLRWKRYQKEGKVIPPIDLDQAEPDPGTHRGGDGVDGNQRHHHSLQGGLERTIAIHVLTRL